MIKTKKIKIEMIINIVETAANSGVSSNLSEFHILTGKVIVDGVDKNIAKITSSQEIKKANNPPVTMPFLIKGNVTLKNISK